MSDLKTSQFSVRCEPALAERVRTNAAIYGTDAPVFIRKCLEAICEMIEDDENNNLPEIVATVRFQKEFKRNPIPLKKPRKTA